MEDIYKELHNGEMPACLKGSCPMPCCTKHNISVTGDQVDFQTLLWDQREADFQLAQGLSETGAVIHKVTNTRLQVPGKKFPDQGLFLLANCQKKDGSCRLEGRKPIACNIYPFSADTDHPLAVTCPSVIEIAKDQTVLDRIMIARRILGFDDNSTWAANVKSIANSLEQIRDLNVQFGSHDYR